MTLAVLTGDIVDSSSLPSETLDTAMTMVETVAAQLSDWQPDSAGQAHTAFARRAGDGWQMAFDQPRFALRAALAVRARLCAHSSTLETRIAAAIGPGRLPDMPDQDLNSAHGPVFTASGQLLDALTGKTRMAFAGSGTLDAAFRLADHIASGWTSAQASAVSVLLPPDAGPRRIAAERLGISRQAIDQALHAAGFPAIDAALRKIEASYD